MAQWSNTDTANSAPKYVVDATTGETGIEQYGNTVFGIKKGSPEAGAGSPGWVRVVKGLGSVTGITITSGGTLYANSDVIEVGADSGTVTTDANGTIITVDVSFSGAEIDELPNVEVTTQNGSGATFDLIFTGRIGRETKETLVAMRNIA